MFKITNDWLDAHRTKKGGWTKAQAEVLCFSWPLKKRWKGQAIGHFITKNDRIKFEAAVTKTCKTKKRIKNVQS